MRNGPFYLYVIDRGVLKAVMDGETHVCYFSGVVADRCAHTEAAKTGGRPYVSQNPLLDRARVKGIVSTPQMPPAQPESPRQRVFRI